MTAWPQTHPIPPQDPSGNTTSTIFALQLEPPGPTVAIAGSKILFVKDKDGNLMVNIDQQGKVTYGEKYKPDDAAKTFWEVLAKYYPVVCEQQKPKP